MAALALAGCGGSAGTGSDLGATLRYLPKDATAVFVLSTDVDGDQWQALDTIIEEREGESLLAGLPNIARHLGLSWEDDVKPLLGDDVAVSTTAVPRGRPGSVVVAFHARGGDRLRHTIDRSDKFRHVDDANGARLYSLEDASASVAVEGDVLVLAGSEEELRAALVRADGGDHLTTVRFEGAAAGLPEDAFLRVYANPAVLAEVPQFVPLAQLPWLAALRSAALAVSFEEQLALVDLALNTDPAGLTPRDLPFATGDDPPEVLRRDGEVVAANRNQSFTTAFLYRLAEVAFPDSRFVREVHALERELGIDFVDEVLRHFNGPSASAVTLDGQTFSARSSVSDPEALRRMLPRIAPHLPAIVEGLQGLQSQGEALLFLLAPDVILSRGNRVTVIVPEQPGGLWRVAGLEGEGPDELYFGVIGSVFVVASTPDLARRVATEPTEEVPDSHGAAVLHANLRDAPAGLLEELQSSQLDPVGDVDAWVQASPARVRGRVSIELP